MMGLAAGNDGCDRTTTGRAAGDDGCDRMTTGRRSGDDGSDPRGRVAAIVYKWGRLVRDSRSD